MSNTTWALLWLMLMNFGLKNAWAAEKAEITAYINAKIYDGEQELIHTAFIVKDGRFLKIGSNQEILSAIKDKKKVSDLKQARVLPGFIESHGHLLGIANKKLNLDLGNKSEEEIIALVKEKKQGLKKGVFIKGRGWDQNLWDNKEFPHHHSLSKASPTNPVFLRRVDGHALWLNKYALDLAKINKDTPDPEGGQIIKDKNGEPTGILIDNAMNLIEPFLEKPSPKELAKHLEISSKECLKYGITSFHDAGISQEIAELYEKFATSGKLKLRIYAMLDGNDQDLVNSYFRRGPVNINDYLSIRSIKYFADGALGSRGAYLLKDYADKKNYRGLLLIDKATLIKHSKEALKNGFQVATHAIGDAATRMVLDSYEEALKSLASNKNARLRIEHAQLVDPADHHRFKKLQVIASMQPIHAISDMPWVDERLGLKRLEGRAYPWASLIDKGAILAFGSDAPVEDVNPLLGLFAATTRQSFEQKNDDVFMPKERLNMKQAMAGYFKNAAFAEFNEHQKGKIAEGYLADFVVFSKDILKTPKPAFLAQKPLMTVVGGKVVYKN